MIWIAVNIFFMCVSLYIAFGKRFRPMSWGSFYINLGAAGINFVALCLNINRYLL